MKRLLILALLPFLASCVTNLSNEKLTLLANSNDGAILAFVAKRGEAEDVKHVNVEFYVRREGFSGKYNPSSFLASPGLHLQALKPGKYRIDDWMMIAGAMIKVDADHPFEFEVRPGEVTYIGSFEIEVERSKNRFGMNVIPDAAPTIKDQFEEIRHQAIVQYPALKDLRISNQAPAFHNWLPNASKPVIIPTASN